VLESCSNPQKTQQVFRVCNENSFFGFGFHIFCEWRCKWISFRPLWPISCGPRPKLLDGNISLKFQKSVIALLCQSLQLCYFNHDISNCMKTTSWNRTLKGGRVWRFRCQRLPAPALISPLIDYVSRWIALLCLFVCIARQCQIVSSFLPGGCCVALQMLMRAGVLSWIKPGERFRSSLGSVMTRQDGCAFCQSIPSHIWSKAMQKITNLVCEQYLFFH